MSVNLVSYSQPHEHFVDAPVIQDVQDMIAYCARVSNPSNQQNTETNERLIKYLIRNQHWSPFEMASATMEIITTRDIARQILRHRSFSFQEFSQRYAQVTQTGSGLEFQLRECRMQDTTNRQNSIDIDEDDIEQKYLAHQWVKKQQELIDWVDQTYSWALKNGMAKEQARAILPEGLTQSRLYMAGTIRSWIHYIELRTAHGTQREHQIIAEKCAQQLALILPMIVKTENL